MTNGARLKMPGIFVFGHDLKNLCIGDIIGIIEPSGGMNMEEITRDTMIGDLLDADPDMESVFLAHGMHCRECSSARGETIEQA